MRSTHNTIITLLEHFEFDEDSYYIVNWIKRKSNNTNIIHMRARVCVRWLQENTAKKLPSIFIRWEIYDRKRFSQAVLAFPWCESFTPFSNKSIRAKTHTQIPSSRFDIIFFFYVFFLSLFLFASSACSFFLIWKKARDRYRPPAAVYFVSEIVEMTNLWLKAQRYQLPSTGNIVHRTHTRDELKGNLVKYTHLHETRLSIAITREFNSVMHAE